MEPSPPQAQSALRSLRIICVSLLASVVMFNFVLTVLYAVGQLTEKEIKKPVPLIFFSLALLLLVSAPGIKRSLVKRSGAEHAPIDVAERAGDYVSANIIAFALREGAGLIGFTLSFLTGNPWWSWGLGGAAVIAMLMDWPRGEF